MFGYQRRPNCLFLSKIVIIGVYEDIRVPTPSFALVQFLSVELPTFRTAARETRKALDDGW
jgi:hypothetical protein